MNQFGYGDYFKSALAEIQTQRRPFASDSAPADYQWRSVLLQKIVCFESSDFKKPTKVIDAANQITVHTIYSIFNALLAERAPYCKCISSLNVDKMGAYAPFIFIDTIMKRLVIVRDIEKHVAFIKEDYVPKEIVTLMRDTGTNSYAVVYMLHKNAALQFVGPELNFGDTKHIKNVYSLPWLFNTYFGEHEYTHFKEEVQKYTAAVEEHLGYIIVRSLNPTALLNFKKITEHSILVYDYNQILNKVILNKLGKKYWIKDRTEYDKIIHQFLCVGTYKALMAPQDFSESLITAEWLLDSMSHASAIDLTAIAMGYFKATEQLLFTLIQLHDQTLDDHSTIGDYAKFYKDNRDRIFRSDIHWTTRNFVYEAIYEYGHLRNGYLHKHNIHNPAEIQSIRSATYILMCLVLGSQSFSNLDIASLKISDGSENSPFLKLYDYIDFYKDSVFCVVPEGYPEQWVRIVPLYDIPQKIRDTEDSLSIYYQLLGVNRVGRFSEKDAPKRIWKGKIKISYSENIELDYEKDLLVYKDGLYTGPSVVEAEDFTY